MPIVLIADDSMFQRFSVGKIAKEEGCEVVEAANGGQCLEKARSVKPDLILLDLNMPGVGGLEVIKSLKDEGLAFKVVVISADIQDTTRRRCEELQVYEFLNKPVEEAKLRSTIKAALSA